MFDNTLDLRNNTLEVHKKSSLKFCDMFFADDETPVQEETKVAANTEKKKKRVKRLVSKMYTTEDGSLGTILLHAY